MWAIYTILYSACMALTNYIDEFLAHKVNPVKSNDILVQIGGLVIVSMLFTGLGLISLFFFVQNPFTLGLPNILAVISGVLMALLFISYFYLMNKYPVYLLIPMFQLASIWLLLIELILGNFPGVMGIFGVILLTYGAYLLDSGTFGWKIPTKLLVLMTPVSILWALIIFLIDFSAFSIGGITASFLQLLGVFLTGVVLFLCVGKFREGFLHRVKTQGKIFLGFSLINESLAQFGYLFMILALAIAPFASYVNSMSGIQGLMVVFLLYFFPLSKERTKINKFHLVAIVLIAMGVWFIEI